ncbi:MAG: hypothetical protein IT331_13505 [Anaerolineae bacterium]|nr:hypothetical protein [Anaerolineae bacterium]
MSEFILIGLVLAQSDPFSELRSVITEILSLLMQICALLLALAIVTGFVEAQLGFVAGRPSLLSEVWFKVGAVAICLLLALTAVPISNLLVDIFF